MSKGSGTRSGLLWEVERLLGEVDELPQVLLMENVPQVMAAENINDFHDWCDSLENKGYKSYAQVLNAKDYGVAQNRERAFMVSILGNYNYHFPESIPLQTCLNDYLEDEVDESYYVNTENAQRLIDDLLTSWQLDNDNIAKSVRGGGQRLNRPSQMGHDIDRVGFLERGSGLHQSNEVFDTDANCRTLYASDYKDPVKIVERKHEELT